MAKLKANGRVITITHPDKILFPKDHITKLALANYYSQIADYMLPYIKNRPLTINVFPRGIDQEGFYRQHAPDNCPPWFKTYKLERKMGGVLNHILCQDKASLIYLVNQNTVAIHRWLSTTTNPEKPEILVIDLDPPHGLFHLACKAAKRLKKSLEDIGYKPYVMTTGSRGLHVISKIEHRSSYEEIRDMLYGITAKIAGEYPDQFSVDVRKKPRENMVYLDITRNAYGQTAIAPFSVRAKDGAPVAVPLAWEELDDQTLAANKYTIKNLFTRLEKLPTEPWSDYGS